MDRDRTPDDRVSNDRVSISALYVVVGIAIGFVAFLVWARLRVELSTPAPRARLSLMSRRNNGLAMKHGRLLKPDAPSVKGSGCPRRIRTARMFL